MLPYRPATALRIDDFRVRPADRPGWVRGTDRLPLEGEEVFCAAGSGTVTELHGKTGDGSRLLRIALVDPKKRPFFAAASNVLLAPPKGLVADGKPSVEPHSLTAAEPQVWLGGTHGTTFIQQPLPRGGHMSRNADAGQHQDLPSGRTVHSGNDDDGNPYGFHVSHRERAAGPVRRVKSAEADAGAAGTDGNGRTAAPIDRWESEGGRVG
jgi:hypothetical protein